MNKLYMKNLYFILYVLIFATMLLTFGGNFVAYAESSGPVVLYTDILSGPNTGGENNNGVYLSIFGKGFGLSRGISKVYINGTEVADYVYWGKARYGRPDIQQISVQPGSSVSSGSIKVVVDGVESNTDHTFTVKQGDIYFVHNTNGSQTGGQVGNINSPFRYVQDTFNKSGFGAGDVLVLLDSGTPWNDDCCDNEYDDFLWIRDKQGTATDNIMIMGHPGQDVRIVRQNNIVRFYKSDGYTTISNLYMDAIGYGQQVAGFRYAQHNRMVNVEVTGMDGYGAGSGAVGGSRGNNKILGCYIHDAGSTGAKTDLAKWFHGLYIDSDAYNTEIGWNHIARINGGRGIQLNGNDLYNVIIHDNLIHDTDLDAINFAGGVSTGVEAYNNILYDFGGAGIKLYSSSPQNLKIYNNTIYGNRGFNLTQYQSVSIHNNIVYATTEYTAGDGPTPSGSNNLWYGAGSPPSWDSNPVAQDPNFASASNKDFHLIAGSPAIDAAVELGLEHDYDFNPRPMDGDSSGGAQPDIGAIEFGGDYVPPEPDTTPPTVPEDLNAMVASESRINLSWTASTDPESGIGQYKVYRDGSYIGKSTTTSYSSTGLTQNTTYTYEISALNGADMESVKSTAVEATTMGDIASPIIDSVTASSTTSVNVVFNEAVQESSAINSSNYTIDNGISVLSASLGVDLKTVTLTTSIHSEDITYSIMVGNVQDVAENTMLQTTRNYQYLEGLIGNWKFDEASGTTASDSSDNNNDATVNGAAWMPGVSANALRMDGTDDLVIVPGTSILDTTDTTWAFWVKFNSLAGSDYNMQTLLAKDKGGCNCYDLNVIWDASESKIKVKYQSPTTGTDWIMQDNSKLTINTGQWHHVVVVMGYGDAGEMSLYLDGVLHDTGADADDGVIIDTDIIVGAGYGGTDDPNHSFFNGTIDEIRLYNRAISAGEVSALYNSIGSDITVPSPPAGLRKAQ